MTCELCGRPTKTTDHHLVPRSRKKKERVDFGPTADLCGDCHRKVHATWDNKTLAREYFTIEKLQAAPELQSFIKWVRKQSPSRYFGSTDSNKRRSTRGRRRDG
jgi:5-methylcytosine-specific restriction protein A